VQAKVWCFVLVPNKPSKGLVYLTTKSLVLWWVRCGYILHPSFSLVLGLVLRERIRCKGKGVKITNLNLDIPYTIILFYYLTYPFAGVIFQIYGKGLLQTSACVPCAREGGEGYTYGKTRLSLWNILHCLYTGKKMVYCTDSVRLF
jgi:hypothetical protein